MSNDIVAAATHILKGIVDYPDDVEVTLVSDDGYETIEARVNPEDLGKVIGRRGKTANAIRDVIGSISDRKYRFDIVDG